MQLNLEIIFLRSLTRRYLFWPVQTAIESEAEAEAQSLARAGAGAGIGLGIVALESFAGQRHSGMWQLQHIQLPYILDVDVDIDVVIKPYLGQSNFRIWHFEISLRKCLCYFLMIF